MSQPPYTQQPGPQGSGQFPPAQEAPKRKKRWFKRPLVWILAAFLVIVIAVNGSGGSETATGDADTSSVPSSTVVESSAEAAADASAQAAAEAEARAGAEARASEEAKAQAEAAALKDPASYTTLADRDLALLVKDPDAHKGEKIVVYGYVSQLDAATGPDTLRASLSASSKEEWYEYEENAIVMAADQGMFGEVVKDDLVTIYATVDGSLSYDTQIGGNTTVPRLTAHIIEVTGSAA